MRPTWQVYMADLATAVVITATYIMTSLTQGISLNPFRFGVCYNHTVLPMIVIPNHRGI